MRSEQPPATDACTSRISGGAILRLQKARRRRRRFSAAFTLVELMIVVAILGLLVAVAIPTYQQARSAALIGTLVGELVGYAKACALINASGVGDTPAPPAVSAERGGVQITQGCTGEGQGATLQASWGTARATGIPCYNSRSLITSSKATVTVSTDSVLSCSFQD